MRENTRNSKVSKIIEKDPPLESSTHKEPSTHKDISKITRSTEDAEGGDKDSTQKSQTHRSLIGQKLDFRVSHDQFEMLISLRSGGLPSAPKSKKWIDKVDLAVALRDVLINEGIENNGVDPDKFHYRSSFIQLENTGYLAFKKVKLPSSINNLPVIEQLIISLLRVEKTLYRMRKTRQEILFDKQGYIDCEDHHRAQ
ncbi:3395_t:CDS:2 [Rhizophagus irregularis]|nr:3395_t:CDS:2 [Rhizophagus irregularis]